MVLPFATTGIASTLLKGGRTVHSGFKLPVPITDTSVSTMRAMSPDAEILRSAVLIIIDEVTILTKDGLRCIDALLRELNQSNIPFGGKVIVIGGDFRQTLPVIPKGTRADIIENCIKSSILWPIFQQISLSKNTRSAGHDTYNRWLLDVGTGNHVPIPNQSGDFIEIPDRLIVTYNNLVDIIYS